MNEQQTFERIVAESVSDLGPLDPSDGAVDQTLARVSHKRQRPQWLALIKEPPMRSNSRVSVGSPTVRVAAIMVATLLLAMLVAGAGVAGQRLLAADGSIVVAKDGSGDYTTISEAVEAADDGDEIHVRPGIYIESVTIDKDITLKGDGPREEIVLEAAEETPQSPIGQPYALQLAQSDAHVSGLTLHGEPSQLYVTGGSPTLSQLTLDGVGQIYSKTPTLSSIVFDGATSAALEDSEIIASGAVEVRGLASPAIIGNVLSAGTSVYLGLPGDDARVEDNEIIDAASLAIHIWGPGAITIRGNTIERAGDEGISDAGRSSAAIQDNIIRDSGAGILLDAGSNATATGNEIVRADTFGISLSRNDATVSDNVIDGGASGIIVVISGSPNVTGNDIDVAGTGLVVGRGASPFVEGNTICGAERSVEIKDGAEPEMGDNEICEAAIDG